jgi:NSS family neurotransmitter:Na+ symporter
MVRLRWDSRLTFIFAAVGSAVGLGNLWRFPYLSYEYGGGSFIIPYLICLVVIGIPLLIMEFAIGQRFQRGIIDTFKKIHPKFEGVGYAAIITSFFILAYYTVVMAWSLLFLFFSFRNVVPWAGKASEFFYKDLLQMTASPNTLGGINWGIFIALIIVWVLIYFSVWKGVRSIGRVVMITVPLPIILLLILLVQTFFLEGSAYGVLAYVLPNFSALLDGRVWFAAASQVFFTLSLAGGIMIAYASYNRKESDVSGNAVTTAVINSAVSLLAGFLLF